MNAPIGACLQEQREAKWAWPIDIACYDCAADLSAAEREHMGRLVARFAAGGRGWHAAARPALERLLRPLHDTLDHLGATTAEKRNNTVRTTVVCLLIRAMHQHGRSFWAFSPENWHEMLGGDYYAYVRQHGVTANTRQQLIDLGQVGLGRPEPDGRRLVPSGRPRPLTGRPLLPRRDGAGAGRGLAVLRAAPRRDRALAPGLHTLAGK